MKNTLSIYSDDELEKVTLTFTVDRGKRSYQTLLEESQKSLAVPWLGLQASTAGSLGSIPVGRAKIPHASLHSQKKKKNSFRGKFVNDKVKTRLQIFF